MHGCRVDALQSIILVANFCNAIFTTLQLFSLPAAAPFPTWQ